LGYVGLFHPRLIGLTGDPRALKTVALAYKVYYAKTDPTRNAGTEVDYTGFIFLVGPDGRPGQRTLGQFQHTIALPPHTASISL
jgi:cytochrome oxidase Cu insertion factor (SCO1/SenC/PrrC family)